MFDPRLFKSLDLGFIHRNQAANRPDPALPSGQGSDPAAEQRAWKTIMEGGTVGNIVAITSAQQAAQVVTVAGPNEQAQVMAITLIPPLVPFGSGVLVAAGGTGIGFEGAVALMQWGVGGGVSAAEIDIGRGCTFSLIASAIRIFIRREVEPPFPIQAAAPNLYGAAISRGPAAQPTRVTRSYNSKVNEPTGIIPGGQFIVTCPPYAKFLKVYSFSQVPSLDGNRPMLIDMQTFNGVSCGAVKSGLNQPPETIEMPNQCSFVLINNQSATETVDMQAVFELAL